MKKLVLLFLLYFISVFIYGQTAPSVYWQFNGVGAAALQPAVGGAGFNITPGDVPYSILSGPVGNYMSRPGTAHTGTMPAGTLNAPTAISFQCLFRPGRNWQVMTNGQYGGFSALMLAGRVNISMNYYNITIFGESIRLASNGVAGWTNLMDGNFHLLSYTYNSATNTNKLYIDGQSPADLTIAPNTGGLGSIQINFDFASAPNYYNGDIDEVAFYTTAITANQVWQNYLDFQAGNHYQTALAAVVPPYANTRTIYDTLQYAIGYYADSTCDESCLTQLAKMPRPRYKPILNSSDSLPCLINDCDPNYLGGKGVGVPQNTSNLVGAAIMKYVAENFNTTLDVGYVDTGDPTDTLTFPGKIIKIKNANPKLHLSGETIMAQINYYRNFMPNNYYDPCCNEGNTCGYGYGCVTCAPGFPAQYYLQNGIGQWVNENGTPYIGPGRGNCIHPQARPSRVTNNNSCYPDTGIIEPGQLFNTVFGLYETALTGTNKFDYIWENGEIFLRYQDGAMNADPVVNADRIASGWTNIKYQSSWRARLEGVYFNQFIDAYPATTGVMLLLYQNQGNPLYYHEWAEMKLNYTPYHGKHISTTDYYMRSPAAWWINFGADHGAQWRRENQEQEHAQGDSLQIPYVSHGWSSIESDNINFTQYLGLLKWFVGNGCVSFFPSVFNNVNGQYGYPNPVNYIGTEMIAPAYAQALATRTERFLHNGIALPGDLKAYPTGGGGTNDTNAAFQYNTGDFRSLCTVRQAAGVNKYAIYAAHEANANMIGNTEDSVQRYITLNGENITFTIHQRGDVYIYDNTDPLNKVFYPLDFWHESKHPTRWSSDFQFQAEVNDNYSPSQDQPLKTDLRSGAPPLDFVQSTTYIHYTPASSIDSVRFNFTPTVTGTYYLWVRLKSVNGVATSVKVRLGTGAAITLPVTNTGWFWYRYDNGTVVAPGVNYSLTNGTAYHLSLIATDKNIDIDQVVLTKTPNAGYPEAPTGCTTASTITPSGATTFCTGGSVTLTALLNPTYLWSNGATTQSVVVTTTGVYTVLVTDGSGCTGISAPTTVTVNTLPAPPVITPSSSTTFCSGGSVDLVSTAGTTYLWSNAATTQTITVTTAATFTVTVTNAAGCTASSASITTTVSALPSIPTITPTGSTTFCSGGSVVLTSSASTSYQWSTGAITSAITTSTAGGYTVTVTNGSGCTRSSATTTVVVNGIPNIAAVAPQQNVCAAVTVDLSAITLTNTGTSVTGKSYFATLTDAQDSTNAIAAVVAASGTYYIRASTANGCYQAVSVAVTIVSCACASPPAANAGPDQNICDGLTATLAGAITNATVGTWTTTGTGTFSPSSTTLAATYTPSAADTVAGSVKLILTTNNPLGAPCAAGKDTMQITLIHRPGATITASGATTFCNGGSVNLVSSLGTSYLWSNGSTTQSVTVASGGTFRVTVTDTYGCTSGRSAATTVVVNSNPPQPTISPSGSIVVCFGNSTTLTSSSATTYLWSTGATTASISVSTTGSYRVTVSNTSGCTRSSNAKVVSVHAAVTTPIITPSGSTALCQGSSVTLTSSSADSYLWTGGATTQSITVSAAGNYGVTVTVNGCTATSALTTVTVSAAPTATITNSGSSNVCFGGSVTLTSSAGASYLWSTGAISQSIVVTTSGGYIVTVTSAAGCTRSSSPTNITVYPAIDNTITPSGALIFCQPQTVTLSAASGYNYLWSNGKSTQSIVAGTSGTYTVIITNAGGCTSIGGPVDVIAYPLMPTPVISPASPINLCSPQTATLSVASTGQILTNWLWSTGATSSTIVVSTSGTYSVTVTNSNGCTAISNTVLVVSGSAITPVITASGSTTICQGQALTLTSTAAVNYLWSNGATTQNIVPTISATYVVTTTDAFGCTKSSAGKVVTINPLPSASILPNGNLTFCSNQSVQLIASPSTSGYTYLWTGGSTTSTVTINTTGTWRVTVTDTKGCSKISASINTLKDTCTITCGIPFGMGVDSIKTTEARIYWAQANVNSRYIVYVKTVGVPNSTRPTDCAQNKRFVKYFNLKANTSYRYWMIGYCGSTPTDSVPAKIFRTLAH